MLLGARIVVELSSIVNEAHLLTPKSLAYISSRLVKKILGSRGVANIHSGSSWGRGKCLGPFWGREAKRVGNRWVRAKARSYDVPHAYGWYRMSIAFKLALNAQYGFRSIRL